MAWTWRYLDADGQTLVGENLSSTPFPTQADAESWIGETWSELLAEGVEAVCLMEESVQVYGPMNLRPAP